MGTCGLKPFIGPSAAGVTRPPPSELRPALEVLPGGLDTASSIFAAGVGRPTSGLLRAAIISQIGMLSDGYNGSAAFSL